MNETDFGYLWDVSFTDAQDTIFIDTGQDIQLSLTRSDLEAMLKELDNA